ncbi:MAG: class I SAM-dependent DNA methyltransferase, partial [Bacteroidales bacterium]|nr:class I SAM-dependent DNA methyltransferase [Bacteroidales bacterium]
FGIIQRKVSSFEYRVTKLDDHDVYIDMLWKGTLLVEMKSKGKNLDKAYEQARSYLEGLKQYELPKYILICDFNIFKLYDLEDDSIVEFQLPELVNNVQHFGFIAGYQKREFKEQDPVNIKAAELMGKLHDKLKAIGYEGHHLELYLVRLLFMLFAEDTTIFDKDIFIDFIEQRTAEDGSDLAARLSELFYILNTPSEKRLKNIDEQLNAFPYVNGKLFEEQLPPASFDTEMRNILIECCYLDWGKISPAIFGSMFQTVMNPVERRNIGAHYTSEKNIMKLIKPLFLDELWAEFQSIKTNKNKLISFHTKLSKLKFLDPACGCGNFLIITYRELRLLEIEILREINKPGQRFLNIGDIIKLNVDMMYGIEYEEFPARIAEVAMWLIDHQMNMLVSQEFGQYFVRLPLTKSANIFHGNALQVDWNNLISANEIEILAKNSILTVSEPEEAYTTLKIKTNKLTIYDQREFTQDRIPEKTKFDYIIGNPPFVGASLQNKEQKADMGKIFAGFKGTGVLDYVAAWHLKAARLIQNTQTKVAFVSTNSISQGEQVGILWNILLNQYNINIHFAHRTFKWSNEAKGKAAVYCVIIGFANFETNNKLIFDYQDLTGEPHELKVKNINPYLVDAQDVLIGRRSKPICNVPIMSKGSQPTDGGFLLFYEQEKNDFLLEEPKAEKYIKPLISAYEFINGQKRFCLWLVDADPSELRQMPYLLKRLENVREMRLKSTKLATVKWADKPMLFTENRQPKSDYILIPSHSSENRTYIPIGLMTKDDILNNSCFSISDTSLYHFGIINSIMHMSWVKHVCGRIKSDFRYSVDIVYNNFPWPESPTEKQIKAIEDAAQNVLNTRAEFLNSSLADLYDPLTTPPSLLKAHNNLDKAVDLAYRSKIFLNEAQRMEFLFDLYGKYINT